MRKHAARMLHILVDRVPETERRVFVNGRALRTTKIIAVAWRALDDEEEAQEAVVEVAAELASDEGGKFERFARIAANPPYRHHMDPDVSLTRSMSPNTVNGQMDWECSHCGEAVCPDTRTR